MRTHGRRREQEASWPAVDLGGLEGTCVTAPVLSRRTRRVVWVVLGASTAVRFASADGGPADWALDALWLLLLLSPFLVVALRPPRTHLTPHALTARTGVLTERTTPWHDVLEVRPPGRWSPHSSAVLRDGTGLDLPGLGAEQAQRLARVVERQHPHHGEPATRPATSGASSATELPDDPGPEGPRSTRRR